MQVVLKPRESIDVPMCVAWYTPVLRSRDSGDYGHYYAAVFQDSTRVAQSLLDNWQALLALTEEWQNRITTSTLPPELDRRIVNSVSTLVTNSIFVRDGRFTLVPSAEATTSGSVETYLQQRRYAANLLLTLFPQLYAQEMVNLLAVRMQDGKFPSLGSDWAARIGPVTPSEEPSEASEGNPIDLPTSLQPETGTSPGPPRIESAALVDTVAFVVQADRLIASTNDLEFLRHAIPSIRSVMLTFQSHDVITDVPNPIGSPAPDKTTNSILTNWLALLRSARRLALVAGAHAFEWAVPAGPLGSSPGGLIEVAAEQHFVELCDSEIIKVEVALSKRVNSFAITPPSGILSLASSGDTGGLKQAFNWDLLNQTEGYSVDLQNGDLDLTTPIPGTWRSLTAPVFSATFVGRTEFKPTAHGGLLTLRIDRTITLSPIHSYRHRAGATGGQQLVIRTIRVAGPPPTSEPGAAGATKASARPLDVHVSLGPNPVGCTVVREPTGTLLLTFVSPLTLLTGDLLQVEVQ